jgi:hypothetical protein
MLTVSEISYLRSTPAEELVDNYAGFCAGRFSMDGVPIVIAAHNEERDLPATLLAAALSDIDVMPIVGENGSDDRTAEFAKRMGAEVRHSDVPAKVGALQLGTQFAIEELGSRDVLYTDADTLVGRKWAGKLLGLLSSQDDQPVVVSGPSIFTHGGHAVTQAVRSTRSILLNARAAALNQPPRMGGHNMALHFDSEGRLLHAYMKLRPELFVGEENAIRDAVIALGGVARSTASPSAIALTRGDRVPSLIEGFKLRRRGPVYRQRLYGDYAHADRFVRYDGANAYSSSSSSSSPGTSA